MWLFTSTCFVAKHTSIVKLVFKDFSTSDVITTSLLDHFSDLAVLHHRLTQKHKHQNISELNLGMLTQFDNLCALLLHLSKHPHYTNHMFYICLPHHTLFICPLLLDSDLLFLKWSIKSPFGNWFKASTLFGWKFFTEYVSPLFKMTGSFYYFLHGYIRRRHWFFFLSFFFFFTCLNPFSLSGTSKRSCKYLWQGEFFWIQRITDLLWIFSPHIGENIFVRGKDGGLWRSIFIVSVCT